MDAYIRLDYVNIICSGVNHHPYRGTVMKLIIAGSRGIVDYDIIKHGYLDSGIQATEIVSGTARGVDRLGEHLANTFNIPIKRFPANWEGLGKKAGYVRNVTMADYADAALVFWNGESKGTKHMIDIARQRGMLLVVYTAEGMRWTI